MERNNSTVTILEKLQEYGVVPENSDIELTEDEVKVALHQARIKKIILLENREKERIRDEMQKKWMTPFTAKELSEFALEKARMHIPDYEVHENLKPIINAFCFYFTGNPQFEKMNPEWSLSKGIYLWGPVGVGKSSLMHMFSQNKRQSYLVLSCRKFTKEYVKYGDEVIDPYRNILYSIPGSDNFLQKQMGVTFDDLGTERDANNYGNKKNIMEEIILDRYDNKVPFNQTHITSNLGADEIEDRYGKRVRSRMREMFNLIEFVGEDLRK